MPITGTVVRLLTDQGVGFIENDGGVRYRFERAAVMDVAFETLKVGQRAIFDEMSYSQKGPRAIKVRVTLP